MIFDLEKKKPNNMLLGKLTVLAKYAIEGEERRKCEINSNELTSPVRLLLGKNNYLLMKLLV